MNCSIEGCTRPKWARGLCGTHYQRLRTTGTTLDPPRLTDEERYLRYVAPPDPNGCRLWTGQTDKDGYGKFTYMVGVRQQRTVGSHRWAYEHWNGAIPGGQVIRHSCDTPACQTIEHLGIGTVSDNKQDELTRGRNVFTVLTDEQVRAVRAAYAAGGVTYRSLATVYGVSAESISHIVTRRRRAYIE